MKLIIKFYNLFLKFIFLFKTKILGYRSIPEFNNINSYNDPDLINYIFNKSLIFFKDINNKNNSNKIFDEVKNLTEKFNINFSNVLDLGGGFGYHYVVFQKYKSKSNLNWHVAETETLTILANEKFKTERLKFFSNIDKSYSYDLLFSSASICYIPDGDLFLENLLNSNQFKYLYFVRTPLCNGNTSKKIKQISLKSEHGPGILVNDEFIDRFCYTNLSVISYEKFLNILKKNFEIIDIKKSNKSVFKIDKELIFDYSLIAKRKNKE
jgi:putative methyltransferase (TIGR04325 family)